METIQIPCPKCGRELLLRDRKLLGRKGKCPKCSHAFMLEEPEAVSLEVAPAEPSPPAASTMWSPDAVQPTATASRTTTSRSPATVPSPFSDVPSFGATDGAAARLKAMQKKNARRRNTGLAVGAVVLAAVGGITYYALTNAPSKPVSEQPAAVQQAAAQPVDKAVWAGAGGAADFTNPASPTKGKPIELHYLPYGTQVILHIRPADLWKDDGPGKEFRYCIPPLAQLIEGSFEQFFKRKPEQIEEAMIGLIPGTQGTLPEVAAVIHLVDEAKKSQLLDEFGGQRVDDFGYPVYVTGELAYMIVDQKTIAVCSKVRAEEMVRTIQEPSLTSDGIEELLPMTDRERHITVLLVPRTLRQHSPWWFADNLRPFMVKICDWFGDDVDAMAWSFHLGEQQFYSEFFLRNITGVTAARLERETHAKLSKLPNELLSTVRMMNPQEVGKRKVIGRVPKMAEVCSLASVFEKGPRHVHIITPLPERAAPNLALGTLLAWDESTRTDFSKERQKGTADEVKVPELVADRLKMKIDAEFSRTPLQEAYAFVGAEIKTKIDIDGDALKAGGFTKNMPQTFKMDKATAQDVIAELLKKYQDPAKPSNTMVIVVDESKKMILVTTKAFCEQKNLTPFDVFKK